MFVWDLAQELLYQEAEIDLDVCLSPRGQGGYSCGGNDGIWEIIMCSESHVSEGYLWYFICVNYRERILYKRGSCCEK